MIAFKNNGVIEVDAITTMGVSVKSSSAIGYFGTGFKFAVATLLRTGHKVKVYAGEDEYIFTTREKIIRGEKFDLVYMNGDKMSFTTQLGRNWEVWQAYRELASNAYDEGGDVFVALDDDGNLPDQTLILVEGEGIEEAYADRDQIFYPYPDGKTRQGQVQPIISTSVYYRKVRVFDHAVMNAYNLKEGITLSEDRFANSESCIRYECAKLVVMCDNEEVIRRAITAPEGMLEHDFDYNYMSWQPSQTFVNVAKQLIENKEEINNSVRQLMKRLFDVKDVLEPIELTPVMTKQLEKSVAFCKEVLDHQVDRFPIVVVEKIKNDALGMADRDKMRILLAKRVFEQGTKQVAATLLEEFFHLRFNYMDRTYDFQNFLHDQIIGLGEKVAGEPI